MRGECSTYGKEKCAQRFGGETRGKEATRKAQMYMGE